MSAMFTEGQRVQCLKNGQWKDMRPNVPMTSAVGPKFGEVCTVSQVAIGEGGVLVLGLSEYPGFQGLALTFLAEHFRGIE